MAGYFKVKSVTELDKVEVGHTICESDFAQITPGGKFVQLEYCEEDLNRTKYKVKPGIWVIQSTMTGLKLESTQYTHDRILASFVSTKEMTDKIDCFFSKFQVYRDHGFEVPKRGILLWGPAGSGKSTCVTVVADKYAADNKTAIVIWPTDKYEAWKVKDFIKTFEYVDGVEKLILVVEDIGGVEMDQVKMKSDSSLLALLDNQEKTFTIPVLIVATTNFPEVFLGNLTNRPNRFDDKLKIGYPAPEHRVELLKFFYKNELSEKVIDLMKANKTAEFSPAHIREVVIRSAIYDKTLENVIEEMSQEIETYNKSFRDGKTKVGFFDD